MISRKNLSKGSNEGVITVLNSVLETIEAEDEEIGPRVEIEKDLDTTLISTTTSKTTISTSTVKANAITTQRKTESMNTAAGTTVTPLHNDIPNNVKVRSHTKKVYKCFDFYS